MPLKLTEEERRARHAGYQRGWRKRNLAYERELKKRPLYRFYDHRKHAAKRGIPFLLTFEEWWSIWEQSGHWHERGNRRGLYVMARFGDCGPYAVGNVKIIWHEENNAEAWTPAKRERLSIAFSGYKHSAEARAKMRGRKRSAETRAKMSIAAIAREARKKALRAEVI